MNDDGIDNLEARLQDATSSDHSSALWRAALDSNRQTRGLRVGSLGQTVSSRVIGFVAVALVCVLIVGAVLPSMGGARSQRESLSVASSIDNKPSWSRANEEAMKIGTPAAPSISLDALSTTRAARGDAAERSQIDASSIALAPTSATRHVVRKATIELRTNDVRALAAKAAMLVNDASGEFVEESNLSGEGTAAWSQLTLRVAASRLSEVLTQLRRLGKVVAENSGGQDVTEQVVDLEARLRNEQQVEQELLRLLASRTDAPLEDILKLRQSIGDVRERIERMMAQRDKLSRLTSLATILVIARHEDANAVTPPAPAGWWARLQNQISRAANDGLSALTATIAFFIWAFVGGLVWWILLAAAIFVAFRLRRAARVRAANEPPPTI